MYGAKELAHPILRVYVKAQPRNFLSNLGLIRVARFIAALLVTALLRFPCSLQALVGLVLRVAAVAPGPALDQEGWMNSTKALRV